jgi:phosphodiesterase/alkaline phosphatase D-like protein
MRRVRRLTTTGLATLGVLAGGLALASAPAFAAAPAVQGESSSSVTPFEAHLEATVNAGEETTECHFQYGEISVSEHEVPCEQGTPPGTLEGGEQGVSANATGLKAKTIYDYRVLVKNATSEAEGAGELETLTLEKPLVESENASGVNSSEATLEAQINPNYQTTTYAFEYATNKALTGAKTSSGATALEGFGGQTGSVSLGGLEPGEVYYYRVAAKNATGTTTYPAVQSFTTVPTPFTEPATPNSGISATFFGHFTLDPISTKWSFDYKLGHGECTGENSTPTLEAGSGATSVTEAWEVPNEAPPLHPNNEYTVCFVTSNAYGSQVGPPEYFTTPSEPPAIDSESTSSLGAVGVELEAKIDPSFQETTYFFEYATEEALIGTPGATTVSGTSPLPAELKELPVSVKLDAAPQPGKTYYYRVVAENESTIIEGKPVTGEIKSYALPVVSTGEAQSIVQTTATLSGTIDPEGAETTYHFAYIDQAGYEKALAGDTQEKANPYANGETTTPLKVTEPGGGVYTGTEPQTIPPTPISGLQPGKTYYYTLVATSTVGSETGQPDTLTTPAPTPPTVSTGNASSVSQNSATLSGTVDTNSLQTNYGFELATEPDNYGPATGLGSIGGASTETITVTLSELQPGTTYYYRITATNADGTSQGTPQTFTTPSFPTLLTTPPSPPLIPTPTITFPTEEKTTTTTNKTLTKTQKLAKALKTCRKDKKKNKRTNCEKQARNKYQPAKTTKKDKKKQ